MVMQTDNQCSELVLRTLIFLWEDEADSILYIREITHEFEFLTSTFIEFRAILGQNRDNIAVM